MTKSMIDSSDLIRIIYLHTLADADTGEYWMMEFRFDTDLFKKHTDSRVTQATDAENMFHSDLIIYFPKGELLGEY